MEAQTNGNNELSQDLPSVKTKEFKEGEVTTKRMAREVLANAKINYRPKPPDTIWQARPVPQAGSPVAIPKKMLDLFMTRSVGLPPTEMHCALKRIHMVGMEDFILEMHGVHAKESNDRSGNN